MKSRLLKGLLCSVLAAAFLLSAVGCGGGAAEYLPSDTAFSDTWNAADYKSYGDTNGELLVASPIASSFAYSSVCVMSKETKLERGIYSFEVQASVPNTEIADQQINYVGYGIGMLRVLRETDSGDTETLGYRELYLSEFQQNGVLQPFERCFTITEKSTVHFEIYFHNLSAITFGVCQVRGIAAEDCLVDDTEGWLVGEESVPAYDAEGTIYYFDALSMAEPMSNSKNAYDALLALFALQGLVNRAGVHLFIRYNSADAFMENHDDAWFVALQEDGKFGDRKTVKIERWFTLFELFEDFYSGIVLWDSAVPATENVACTVAGVENLLPVRYDDSEGSVYNVLKAHLGSKFVVGRDLTGKFESGNAGGAIWDCAEESTGSAKCDAYLWAKEKYLDTGRVSETIMANHLDAYSWDPSGETISYFNLQQVFLANKDYYIANKAFFWDLNVWDNTLPNDDPEQPLGADYKTLVKILEAQNKLADGQLVTVGGFVPWYIKYTNQSYGGGSLPGTVDTEWRTAQLLGTYYMVKDADAYGWTSLANASVYSQLETSIGISQPNRPSETEIQNRMSQYINEDGSVKPGNYIFLYMGDYDAAAWMITAMMNLMNDPNLGSYPMTFPVNFGPSGRIPFIYEYMYEKAAENGKGNVYFAGDHNGYGYIDLEYLTSEGRDSELKGSLDSFMKLTKKYWDAYDLDLQSFLIKTTSQIYPSEGNSYPYSDAVLKAVSEVATGGVTVNSNMPMNGFNVKVGDKSVPWSRAIDLPAGKSTAEDLTFMSETFGQASSAVFTQLRMISKTPSYVRSLLDKSIAQGADITVLDQYTYFALNAYYNEHFGLVKEI